MASEFNAVKLVHVEECGLKFEVSGTWNDKPYHVDVWIELEGRDVEIKPMVEGEFNPNADGPDFTDALFSNQRFIELHNRGYDCWSIFPAGPTQFS